MKKHREAAIYSIPSNLFCSLANIFAFWCFFAMTYFIFLLILLKIYRYFLKAEQQGILEPAKAKVMLKKQILCQDGMSVLYTFQTVPQPVRN